ncbi:MAG: type II secretion system F family protein [Bacillaceae bacterium]|nr:type II secretion system F family protein [Bacillaceae bacterium]
MKEILLLSIFATTLLLFYGVASLFSRNQASSVKRRLNSLGQPKTKEEIEEEKSLMERAIVPLTNEVRKKVGSKISGGKKDELELKLLQAGNPFNLTPVDFRLIQILFVIIIPIILAGYFFLIGYSTLQVILVLMVGVAFSLWYPQFYLQQKAKKRRMQALKELPDFLDLLTVSMEAGLGFDSSIGKIVEKEHGVLGEEFSRYLDEIRIGRNRRESLNSLKERMNLDELTGVINGILQADRMGIGMVNVLRIQSDELRDKRKQRAEEAAMKAPIKMLFPLVIFIFPSIFIVLLAPTIIQLVEMFTSLE